MGVEDPVVMEDIVEEEGLVDLVATEGIAGVEDPVDLVDIMVATEDTTVDTEGILGEAISTEVPAATSADTLGSPTTIPTVITLTPITILTPTPLLIIRMLPSLPPTPNRSKTPIGTTARLPKGITPTSELSGWVDEGGSDSSPVGERKEVT